MRPVPTTTRVPPPLKIDAMTHSIRSTTIISVRRGGRIAVASDGQVTIGSSVVKGNANKLRRLYHNKVLVGFAGGVADALMLTELFEAELEKHHGHLVRAAVELAKTWRSERALRRLEALLAVADIKTSLLISGTGEVIEPPDGILAIGSGSDPALAAARALCQHTELGAREVAVAALKVAAEICIYTNEHLCVEELGDGD